MSRQYQAFLALASALLAVNSSACWSANTTIPNIVVFLVDDLGWQDTSVSFTPSATRFNQHYRTPNLGRLANQGVRFTNAYACAVCSPSRTSIMTGLNAARHGVTNWTLYADRETSGQTERLQAPLDWNRKGLQPDSVTLPSLLRELGYRTIHVGKAHWGAYDTAGADPTNLGFDICIAGHAAGGPGGYAGEDNFGNKEAGTHSRPWGVPGLESYHGTAIHLTDALTIETKKVIEKTVQEESPFFLYFAPYAVHAPIQPHPRFVDHYRGRKYPGTEIEIPEAEAKYASMVEGVDDALGQLLSHLDSLGVAQETIILFLSDNGGLSRHSRGTTPYGGGRDTHNWPLREGKGSAYEGGTRVPFVVSWARPHDASQLQASIPISTAATQDTPVIIEDVMPTVARWAGGDPITDVDGQDVTPLLDVESSRQAGRDVRPLVFHYPHQWTGRVDGGYQPHSAIRLGAHKAIYFYETEHWELYDLRSDLGEEVNLAHQDASRLQTLATELKAELERHQASWPTSRRSGMPMPLKLPHEVEFPQQTWKQIDVREAGWDASALEAVAGYFGGRGMMAYRGRVLYEWGDVSKPADVASAAKPVFVHFLAQAAQEGHLSSFDESAATWNPTLKLLNESLGHKDRKITFRHLANQTSCYGVSEDPGAAFDYNDYQTALFFDTLFVRLLRTEHSQIDGRWLRPMMIDQLGCQDFPSFFAFGDADRPGRLRISPRDFCRFGLLYLRGGQWRGERVLDPAYVRLVTRSPLPLKLPRTSATEAEMLPEQRSLGSRKIPDDQTDHLGCYSWMWWVNGRRASGLPLWPDAPEAFACLGHKHGKRGMVVVPTWDLVISWNDSQLDQYPWDDQVNDHIP